MTDPRSTDAGARACSSAGRDPAARSLSRQPLRRRRARQRRAWRRARITPRRLPVPHGAACAPCSRTSEANLAPRAREPRSRPRRALDRVEKSRLALRFPGRRATRATVRNLASRAPRPRCRGCRSSRPPQDHRRLRPSCSKPTVYAVASARRGIARASSMKGNPVAPAGHARLDHRRGSLTRRPSHAAANRTPPEK
jgi:hypothetical protein